MNNLEHIIHSITESEELVAKQTKLSDTVELFEKFTTLEKYPVAKLLALYAYLSDLSLDHPLDSEKDTLFLPEGESTLSGRIHSQLRILERILNLPDEVPSTIVGSHLILVNAYGFRSDHLKGRMYGYRNTMTLLSRQCRCYLFKDLYFDVDLKNAHPTILFSYALNNNLTVDVLKRYIDDRESFLLEVMQVENITRSDAKTNILRCLNLVTDKSLPNHLKALHKDIVVIREHIYRSNVLDALTPLGQYTQSRPSFQNRTIEGQKISLQAQYCATEESESLRILYEVCLKKGLLERDATLNSKIRSISFIPFFDGAYIMFENLENETEVRQILEDTNELIYPYSFELKEIESDWTYINEERLKTYEVIHHFLGSLNEKQYTELLKLLEIPEFSLSDEALTETLNKVDSKVKAESFSDVEMTRVIEDTAKTFKYKLRRKLLEYIEKGSFLALQTELGLKN